MATVAPRLLEDSAIKDLEAKFEGEVIGPAHPAYEEARRVWNASIDKYPALVVRPLDVKDVAAALHFARDKDLIVAVRGGSHSVAGFSTCDGGLVIDFSAMKGVRIDAEQRRAYVGPGAVWGEVDPLTQASGLAVTGGLISSTGVAGFTLGGGIGWLQRRLGLACDNLLSADVVTADGSRLHASEDENSDLFWALRGGGGNFGIVTSFEFQLHPVGPEIRAGLRMWPGDRATDVLTMYRDYFAGAPGDLTLAAVLRLAPPAPFVPAEFHGKPIVGLAVVYVGPPEKADEVLAPIDALGEPIVDLVAPRPYIEMQTLTDAAWGPGFQNYWKAEYLSGLPDEAIAVLVDFLGTITSPLSDFKFPYLGGAIGRVGEDDTAYGHRDAPFILNINSRWADPEDSDRHIEWTRALWQAMQPYSGGGTYTNFMSADDGDRIEDSYGSAKYQRLAELKRRYDPTNLFRLNQNIQPSG
ncbi:MAG: FAD-binding oxidoreductase [Actinomycetota bacterium]